MNFNALNLDLLSVGVTVAAIGILGFVIYFSDKESATNKIFLAFALLTIVWGITNFFSYQVKDPDFSLKLFRVTIFLGTWHSFLIFLLLYIFPRSEISTSRKIILFTLPLALITSIIALTPLALSSVEVISETGRVQEIKNGPGMALFLITIFGFITAGIIQLVKKTINARGIQRKQFLFVLMGVTLTFFLILLFNVILPATANNPKYIPLGALFIIPFVAFTFYSISKYKLLDAKVVSTEILTFVITIVAFVEVIISHGIAQIIFRSGVFVLLLIFGILLIKSVVREVEQRERIEKLAVDLKAVNYKLKIADRMKSQFLSFASHQVKSPMTVVKGYAQLIKDGMYGDVPDKVKETAEKIKEASDRLISLVNNLLDLRKLEEGKIEYNFEEIRLDELMREVCDELRELSAAKKLELSLDMPSQSVVIKADKEKLRQVFQNLVDNSIKYTKKGTINVKLSLNGGSVVRISVSDTGMGMTPDIIASVFEQFNRGGAEAKKIQGTGLGLYIAKQFVEAHKGKVWAESPGQGKGSTFIVELPIS